MRIDKNDRDKNVNLSKHRLYYEFNYIREFKTGEMEDQILVFLRIYWHKIS